MNQNEINRSEWENPDNWSRFSIYFSKKDSRTWVPKQIPTMGTTINLGTAAGARWFIGILLGLPLLTILFMSLVCVGIYFAK